MYSFFTGSIIQIFILKRVWIPTGLTFIGLMLFPQILHLEILRDTCSPFCPHEKQNLIFQDCI